jgi:hypothetical protein
MQRPNASIWQAPLVPVGLALTGGIIVDRYAEVPIGFSLAVILAGLIAWAVMGAGALKVRAVAGQPHHPTTSPPHPLALIYLAISLTALGAAYHHWQRDVYAADDIGNFATGEPRPVRLRGVIVEEPEIPRLSAAAYRSVALV